MHLFTSSLKSQITLLAVLLVLITTIVIQATSWWSANQFNRTQIDENVADAANVLTVYATLREELLINASTVLTADFGFKQAVASLDSDTIRSALQNQASRINADLMLLTDLQGNLIANTRSKNIPAQSLKILVNELRSDDSSAKIVSLDQRLYQIILQPVRAPHAIALNLVGFEIDDEVLNTLKQLADSDISFLVNDEVALTSLNMMQSGAAVMQTMQQHSSPWLGINRSTFTNTELSVNTTSFNPVSVLLSYDMRPIYQQYDELAMRILLITVLTTIIAMLIGAYLSKTMIMPLTRLIDLAKQFSRGNYTIPVGSLKASSEIMQLGSALRIMGREIESRENKIAYQADHDTLTTLFNAPKFRKMLTSTDLYLSQRRIHIALYIENFRQINDRLGPEFADECLRVIGSRLQSIRHPLKQMHSRLDGIEFISVFELDDSMRPSSMVESLLNHLEAPIRIKEVSVQLNFFCGVTFSPDDGETPQIILRRTRIAADHARTHRKRIHCYEPGQDEDRMQELLLVEALNSALEQNSNELYLHFQPKIELQTQRIHTVETLIRWQRPGAGNVAPDLFIDLAEQAGFIVQLTRWVVENTFAQLQRWHQKGLYLQVAINVSAEDVCHADFCDLMLNSAQKFGIDPKYCVIEITERDIMYDEAIGLLALRTLKKSGFKVALDDYGVGQSALFKLKHLPVDELKLDKSFIMRLNESPADQHIVRSTIMLAHDLGMLVVAEGVENAASLVLLSEMGCDAVQGYFLSKPLSAEHLENWLEANNNEEMAKSIKLATGKS